VEPLTHLVGPAAGTALLPAGLLMGSTLAVSTLLGAAVAVRGARRGVVRPVIALAMALGALGMLLEATRRASVTDVPLTAVAGVASGAAVLGVVVCGRCRATGSSSVVVATGMAGHRLLEAGALVASSSPLAWLGLVAHAAGEGGVVAGARPVRAAWRALVPLVVAPFAGLVLWQAGGVAELPSVLVPAAGGGLVLAGAAEAIRSLRAGHPCRPGPGGER